MDNWLADRTGALKLPLRLIGLASSEHEEFSAFSIRSVQLIGAANFPCRSPLTPSLEIAPMPGPSPSPPSVNTDELLARLGQSRSALTQLVPLLAESAARWQAEFSAALDAADAERLRRSAHQAKGALLTFAAAPAAALALTLESLAKNGDLANARPVIVALLDELRRVQAALHDVLR
jgi:HPt (histidine-containing phosphotransfer) domain-containing protein